MVPRVLAKTFQVSVVHKMLAVKKRVGMEA